MKKRDIIIGSIIFLIFLLFNISVLKQIMTNRSKNQNIKNEIMKVDEKIEKTDIEIEKYDKFIANLENDFEQESIARNKLKMIKEGEVIYKLIKKEKKEED
ncbi:MAG: septum formation initiator family protein [Fusobacterium sp.]|nr:septum formation initiator family protein [Fusobacterium sp.]